MVSRIIVATLLLVIGPAAAVSAQQTTEELTALFLAQKRVISEVRADPSLGKSRGISLQRIDPSVDGGVASPEVEPNLVLQEAAEPPANIQVSLDRAAQANVQIQFAFDSAQLDATAEQRLRTVCAAAVGADVEQLRIVGHSDARGDSFYNQDLSFKRAEAVARFFTDTCKIDPSRLKAVGVGEQFPFDPTNPFADVNRRVEFQAMS